MIEPEYRVISEGKVRPGNDPSSVKQHVAALFKSDAAKIDRLFAGRDVVVKSRIPYEVADKYLSALNKAGLACRVEPEQETRGNGGRSEGAAPAVAGANGSAGVIGEEELPRCPACGYLAKDKNDDLIVKYDGMGECPVCGIIVSKYREARERAQEKPGPADSPSVAVDHEESEEPPVLTNWPVHWRSSVILCLVITILAGWKIGILSGIVIAPSYYAYHAWEHNRRAAKFYALFSCGSFFVVLFMAYIVTIFTGLLMLIFRSANIKRYFLPVTAVLLGTAIALPIAPSVFERLSNRNNGVESVQVQNVSPERRRADHLFDALQDLMIANYEETGVLNVDANELVNKYGGVLTIIDRAKLTAAIASRDLFAKSENGLIKVAVRIRQGAGTEKNLWHIYTLKSVHDAPEYTRMETDRNVNESPW
jgi:hypothetical protein